MFFPPSCPVLSWLPVCRYGWLHSKEAGFRARGPPVSDATCTAITAAILRRPSELPSKGGNPLWYHHPPPLPPCSKSRAEAAARRPTIPSLGCETQDLQRLYSSIQDPSDAAHSCQGSAARCRPVPPLPPFYFSHSPRFSLSQSLYHFYHFYSLSLSLCETVATPDGPLPGRFCPPRHFTPVQLPLHHLFSPSSLQRIHPLRFLIGFHPLQARRLVLSAYH